MAVSFEKNIKVYKNDDEIYSAHIQADVADSRVKITVYARNKKINKELSHGEWVIDFGRGNAVFDTKAFKTSLSVPCVLGCMMGAGSSIVACMLNAKTQDDVWKCIENNVGALGIGAIGCVIGCL